MEKRPGEQRIHPGWWALMLFAFTAAFLFVTSAIFLGTFKSSVPVTLTSDRSGIIMETNAKVKMRGVQVGRVSQVGTAKDGARLTLEMDPDQIRYIPANVEAQIDVTTAFGAKFVSGPSSSTLCLRRTRVKNGWLPARCCIRRMSPQRSTRSSKMSSSCSK